MNTTPKHKNNKEINALKLRINRTILTVEKYKKELFNCKAFSSDYLLILKMGSKSALNLKPNTYFLSFNYSNSIILAPQFKKRNFREQPDQKLPKANTFVDKVQFL